MKKKLILSLLGLMIVASLSACGSQNTANADSKAASNTTSTQTTATTVSTTALICAIHFVMYFTKYAASDMEEKDLRVTIPENLDYSEIFDDLFEKYTKSHKQIAVKTTNMGSMYEINYRVKLNGDKMEKSFLDEIRMRNGNLTVVCGRCDVNEAEEL